MGKRSSFERIPRDFYPTPAEAVTPLLAHLPPHTRFCEPCAGDGALIDALEAHGHTCAYASDIEPRGPNYIAEKDALTLTPNDRWIAYDFIITNPPWDRKVLHPLIDRLSRLAPFWALFDADWMHTRQSAELIRHCRRIVSVGRVKWIPDSKMTGKDNCAWYLFDQNSKSPTEFIGRAA